MVFGKGADAILLFAILIIIILGTVRPIREGVINTFNIIGEKLGLDLNIPGGSTSYCDIDISYCNLLVKLKSGENPSLTAAEINTILQRAGSPAVNTGQKFYDESSRTRIDDVFALAFFRHESDFGTQGDAGNRKSIGNIEYKASVCKNIYGGSKDGRFCKYPTWEAGITAWYNLIKDGYVDEGRDTVGEIIEKYAPCEENDVQAYVASIRGFVEEYTALDVSTCPLA